jgi:Flp pilus assembly protein TadD
VALSAGVAYTEDGKAFSGMGTVFADLDNHGLPDILTTSLPYEYYALFRNIGKGQFNYTSVSTGLAATTRPYAGWGTYAFDYDNDTAKEVFFANGHVMDNIEVTQPHMRTLEPPLLLKYAGNKFADISGTAGDVFTQAWAARGAAFGDLDNDGDIDIVVTDLHGPAHFLRNDGGNRNHWIVLDLRGTKSNRDAIGAQVRLTSAEGKVQYAAVSTAGSYLSASDRRLHFGLGREQSIREIQIKWPSGAEQIIAGPKADQTFKIVETAQAAAPAPVQVSAKAAAQQKFDSGFALARQGKIAEATAAFRDAVKLNPDLTEAHFSLGVLLARQGKPGYAEAMQQFLEVLRLHPADVDALVNISNLLEEEGNLHAAVTTMQKAVALAPGQSELLVMLGQKQDKAGQYPDAVDTFRKALQSGRTLPRAQFGLGMALKHLRKFEESAEAFGAAIRMSRAMRSLTSSWARSRENGAGSRKRRRSSPKHYARNRICRRPMSNLAGSTALRTAGRGRGRVSQGHRDQIRIRFRRSYLGWRALQGPGRLARAVREVRELKARSAGSGQANDLNTKGVQFMVRAASMRRWRLFAALSRAIPISRLRPTT